MGIDFIEIGLQLVEIMGEVCGGFLVFGGFDLFFQGLFIDGFFFYVDRVDEDIEGRLYVSCLKSFNFYDLELWIFFRQDFDLDVVDIEEVEYDFLGEIYFVVFSRYIGEEELVKLQEDMKVKEYEDKDDVSGCLSFCLSIVFQMSSVFVVSGSVKMISFVERKFQRFNSCEIKFSISSF